MNPLPPEEIESIAQAVGLPAEKVREIEAALLRAATHTLPDVPTTDEEAIEKLKEGASGLMQQTLIRLFQCWRAMGKPLLDSYEDALRASVGMPLRHEEGGAQ